jgi:hypothetical protein
MAICRTACVEYESLAALAPSQPATCEMSNPPDSCHGPARVSPAKLDKKNRASLPCVMYYPHTMTTAQSQNPTSPQNALYFFQFAGSDLTAGGIIKGAGFEYRIDTSSLSAGSTQRITAIYNSGALAGEISWNIKHDIWHHETIVRMGGNTEWMPWMKFLKPLPIEDTMTA